MDMDDMFSNTGLDAKSDIITMQNGNIYLVFTSEEDGESCGLSLLTSDGGNPVLRLLAYGMFELLHNNPELLKTAGMRFIENTAELAAKARATVGESVQITEIESGDAA